MKIEIQASGKDAADVAEAVSDLAIAILQKPFEQSWQETFGTAHASAVVVKEEGE